MWRIYIHLIFPTWILYSLYTSSIIIVSYALLSYDRCFVYFVLSLCSFSYIFAPSTLLHSMPYMYLWIKVKKINFLLSDWKKRFQFSFFQKKNFPLLCIGKELCVDGKAMSEFEPEEVYKFSRKKVDGKLVYNSRKKTFYCLKNSWVGYILFSCCVWHFVFCWWLDIRLRFSFPNVVFCQVTEN
jgi:hypothetical protein